MNEIAVTKKIMMIIDRDGHVLEITPSGSLTIFQTIKCRIMSQPDLNKLFEWAEIDGVRRVTKITFSSAIVNGQESSNLKIERVFSYQVVDPFDLVSVAETLVIT